MAPLNFISAYRQLRPAEKAFVDQFVANAERDAIKNNERLSLAVQRPIHPDVIERSRGMLESAMIRAAIVERIMALAAEMDLTAPRVLKELRTIAFSSINDYVTVDERGLPVTDFAHTTPEQWAAVASLEIEENMRTGVRKTKFKMHDKLTAIDKLMRHMGMLESDNVYWRMNNATPVEPTRAPANASDEQLAQEYARMIEG